MTDNSNSLLLGALLFIFGALIIAFTLAGAENDIKSHRELRKLQLQIELKRADKI